MTSIRTHLIRNAAQDAVPAAGMRGSPKRPCVRFAAALALIAGTLAHAQVTGSNKTPGDDVQTIHVTRTMVVESVTVKDKQGKSIPGLTKNDFTLTEDGAPQKIDFCEFQSLPLDSKPLGPAPAGSEDIKIYNHLSGSSIAGEGNGELKYANHRLLALYFDMAGMPQSDQIRALTAAQKFIRTQMTDADYVAIMRYAGASVDILQDFTDDRNRLLSILETMIVGEGQGDAATEQDDANSDTGAAFGQDDAEFNIFSTDRQLSALQTAAESLGRLNEKKVLIYFASGLQLNGIDNQAQLHATEDAAIRAGVSFWPIDARGLVASGAFGDATRGSPGGQAMYTGGAANAFSSHFQQTQDTLYALAGDTGGKALLDNNDLGQGIVNAQRAVSDYYILGYYTSNNTLDGKFRKIKVTVNNQTALNLDYRQGYFAGKVWGKYNTADKERQLEDALMQQDPWTELTIGLEINYFQLNRAEYFLPIMMKIPGSELALAKKRGADHALIDFVGEIKDDYGGTTVSNIRDHIDAKLTDQTVAELAKRPIEYYSGYTLLPGKYTIKVLARDDQTGHIGTFQSSFLIPNLNKEEKHIPTSSVVLSGERQPLGNAIYSTTKGKELAKNNAADPLVQNNERIIPSVTRVFNKGRNLYVYLQAYQQLALPQQPAATSSPATAAKPVAPPLIAFVSLYRDQRKVFETKPLEVSPNPNTRLQVTPINFNIDLSSLSPGKYDCQVSVLDPTTGKSSFWQEPIMLVQ